MNIYKKPELKITLIEVQDVITSSTADIDGGNTSYPDSWLSVDGASTEYPDSW